MNILIKLMSIVSLVIAPHLNSGGMTTHSSTSHTAAVNGTGTIMITLQDGNVSSAAVSNAEYGSLEGDRVYELQFDIQTVGSPDQISMTGFESAHVYIPGEANYNNGFISGEGMLRNANGEFPVMLEVTLTNDKVLSGKLQLH